jgi:hypothetical protein
VLGDDRPGLNPKRLVGLMNSAVGRCQLDLSGRVVLTEAATGAYAVTPVLAAMAGATVYALAATTRYATRAELERSTMALADLAGVAQLITLTEKKDPDLLGMIDIVTNSGQVRPIDAAMVSRLKPTSVISLMYESWEYRAADVDLPACRARGIEVAGVNERHPAVDVFSYLGMMAVQQLHEAGIPVYGSRIALLCDNPFQPFIATCLRACGANVAEAASLTPAVLAPPCDAIVVALEPGSGPVLSLADINAIAGQAPGAVVLQYWGDLDRPSLAAADMPVWPPQEPSAGHMGVLPSAIGPDPIVRLQAGGLKVGELLARRPGGLSRDDLTLIQIM